MKKIKISFRHTRLVEQHSDIDISVNPHALEEYADLWGHDINNIDEWLHEFVEKLEIVVEDGSSTYTTATVESPLSTPLDPKAASPAVVSDKSWGSIIATCSNLGDNRIHISYNLPHSKANLENVALNNVRYVGSYGE